jgi:hypothetical protein
MANSEYVETLRIRLKAIQTAILTLQDSGDVDSYTIFGSVTVSNGNRLAKLQELQNQEHELLYRIMLSSGVNRKVLPWYLDRNTANTPTRSL